MLKKIALFCLFLIPVLAYCQPKDNSPYSRFGIGDVVDRNFAYSQFMGGLGASFYDPYSINVVNPASLSYMTATSFDIGLFAESSGLRDGATDNLPPSPYQNIWKGNLSYLSLAIPLQNKLNDLLDRKARNFSATTAFTLMPYSTVGYNVKIDEFDDNIGEIKKRFEGSGGTYQFLWSNGVRHKNMSFGLNLGYLFGKLEYSRTAQFETNQPFFSSLVTETNRINGFIWNAGAMYSLYLNKKEVADKKSEVIKKMSFGLHFGTNTGMNVKSSIFEGAVLAGLGIVDTLTAPNEISTKGTLPAEIGLGTTYYHGEKFALGFNYSTTKWSQFEASFVNNSLKNTSRLSFGGFYRPNYKSIGSYFSRVFYRFGFFLNQVPNEVPDINSDNINDIGFSLGFGLPFFYQRKISHANLGFTLGMIGKGSAVEERYFKISFSFTFNDDEWLLKRKYN